MTTKSKIMLALAATGLTLSANAIEFTSAAPALGEVVNDGTMMNVRVIAHAEQGKLNAMKQSLEAFGATIHVEGKNWVSVTVGVHAGNYQDLMQLSSVRHVEKDQKRVASPIEARYISTEEFNALQSNPTPSALYRWEDGEAIPYGLDAVQAFGFAPNAANMPKVCIVDTGYDYGHPDLPTQMVSGESEGAGPWDQDGNGHGTHVTGTIAAVGGNGGLVGVISEAADLHIVRVFNDAGGFVYASDLAGAVQDCADAGAKVVSMSLGGILSTEAEEETLEDLADDGILLFAAAGNDGNASHSYPASYEFVYSVAAVDQNNDHAGFSQRTGQVQFAAPGVDVISTVPGGYAFLSGTSMATPHVSAVAALVWSHYPECDSVDMLEAFQMSAKDLGKSGYDYKTGHGLIQVKAAFNLIKKEGC